MKSRDLERHSFIRVHHIIDMVQRKNITIQDEQAT
jgi:hypothetical protein